MSEKTKSFGAGAILTGMIMFLVTGAMGMMWNNASHVPELEATFKTEIKHLNLSLNRLDATARETNKSLKAYTEYHAINIARITESLVTHKYKFNELEKDCDENRREIIKCKERQ